MLQTYSAFLDRVERILFTALVVLSMAMTLCMLYQIILRYCFSAANIWAEEVTRYMFAWVTMLGSSIAIRRNVHLKIDFLVDALSPKSRLILQIFSYCLVLIFLLYLCRLGFTLVGNTMTNRSAAMRIPMAVPYACVPLGAVLMVLTCVEFLCKKAVELKSLTTKHAANSRGAA